MKNRKILNIMSTLMLLCMPIAAAASPEVVNASTSDSNQQPANNKNGVTLEKNPSIGPGYYPVGYSISGFLREISLRMSDTQKENFLSEIKAGAIEGWKEYGILPSLTGAQAALESNFGADPVSGYNIFGIKGNGQSAPTTENINGHLVHENQDFANASSYADSIEQHNRLLGTSYRYRNLVGNRNYISATDDVQADGYATASNYAYALQATIEEYNLTKWDQEAFNGGDFPENAVDMSVITINYVPNYGVNAYNSSGEYVSGSNQVFKNGTSWKTSGSQVINGQEMYEVATNEYIPVSDTTEYNNGVVVVNYQPNYGVLGYRLDGSSIPGSNSVLKTGTTWKTDGAALINGQVMYRIASDEYIPKEYTQFGNGN
ncbi:glycoside hydrolase family 73 protein [Companilactobacillus metriopterae]|uniref:glycoside hydrolase family 73 protein n=1 Tax=Companilactobacillus metriopterae TaxID=1909267 RepID=UPI00100ADB81|nr:glucosaminidase domain-containing protein [Companilactobacillus metriopterae]